MRVQSTGPGTHRIHGLRGRDTDKKQVERGKGMTGGLWRGYIPPVLGKHIHQFLKLLDHSLGWEGPQGDLF